MFGNSWNRLIRTVSTVYLRVGRDNIILLPELAVFNTTCYDCSSFLLSLPHQVKTQYLQL